MQLKSILIKITLTFSLLVAQTTAMAQDNSDDLVQGSIKDISVVVGTGLGGAILGLSTLSFVEEPKEHLDNILVGGSIGIILGVGIVAWSQATKSKGMYEEYAGKNNGFDTASRDDWHKQSFAKNVPQSKNLNALNYSFTF
ncbi:hypothetical protein HBN50_12235 [Halobacteriovorax sp. GB3]|uniref:hypothetical protein n=1 Tax=Halobacteriovorax sp. GB3 TaxID=2719615 RepID=UPI00236205B1|nr:hypothetical protein [Halobacteriovorax sp. GB3]MDD0853871.1 hypothetical protein [Halobacteriovorax sp. GB3]